ncbi:unnamed protein product, partial [Nesidiocoris tenuis]
MEEKRCSKSQRRAKESHPCSQCDKTIGRVGLNIVVNSLPPTGAGSSLSVSEKGVLKLPKLELRKFDIQPRTWISFWACFRKIHERTDIDAEDKFQLLLLTAQEGTAARQLLDSFPPSSENYEKAISQLKSRFGRPELLIELYVRELLNLVLTQASGKNTLSLSQLHDRLETQLLALESLGVTSEKYACMLSLLVESCLPDLLLREWERLRISDGGDDGNSFLDAGTHIAKLREFLRRE